MRPERRAQHAGEDVAISRTYSPAMSAPPARPAHESKPPRAAISVPLPGRSLYSFVEVGLNDGSRRDLRDVHHRVHHHRHRRRIRHRRRHREDDLRAGELR